MEKCQYHDELAKSVHAIATAVPLMQKDMEYLRRDVETILARFSKHVEEAEKEGGRHERLAKAELDIQNIIISQTNDRIVARWFMIGSGVISGLVVAGGVEFATKIIGAIK